MTRARTKHGRGGRMSMLQSRIAGARAALAKWSSRVERRWLAPSMAAAARTRHAWSAARVAKAAARDRDRRSRRSRRAEAHERKAERCHRRTGDVVRQVGVNANAHAHRDAGSVLSGA